jgi:hypothetical protein
MNNLQDLVEEHIPWVHKYKTPKECTGWMRANKRCKNPAYWRFTSIKSKRAWSMNQPNGTYCWSHLISRGIYGSMEEEARTNYRWYEVGVLCQSVSPNGHRCGKPASNHTEHYDRLWTEPYSDNPEEVHYGERWTD